MAGKHNPSPDQVSGQVVQDNSLRDKATTSPAGSPNSRRRGSSNATDTSRPVGRLRAASNRILEANVPVGMWSATSIAVAQAPTPVDIMKDSYGRRDSEASSTKIRSDSQTSAGVTGETRGSRSASAANKLDKITDNDDDFPPNVFGRPELENQSYVRGQRASVVSQRVPKLAVRRRTSQEGAGSPGIEVFEDAVESQQSRPQASRGKSTEAFPEYDDSDLDELDPRPKRKSKNVDAMLGRATPEAMPAVDRPSSETGDVSKPVPNEQGVYPNGYSFPKPKPRWEATKIGFMAFLRFTFTPAGFLIVLYGLNVVAWGGMLFLLLCNASPAMCQLGDGRTDCNEINSPRRVWVEIDSQILNALFCVTGFGLIPWRFRDLYYWVKWRVNKKEVGLRKLAGYHNGWFRLPRSDHLSPVKDFRESELEGDIANTALPFPLSKTPAPPLTGGRAPPTALWKMDFVVWAFVWNTFLQAVLSGFMWGMNRYDRPSWSTGLFVALACIVAAAGGLVQFLEGKNIKKVEGVPLEVEQEYKDVEKGMRKKEKGQTNENEKVIATTSTTTS